MVTETSNLGHRCKKTCGTCRYSPLYSCKPSPQFSRSSKAHFLCILFFFWKKIYNKYRSCASQTFHGLAKHPRWPTSKVTLTKPRSDTNQTRPRDCVLEKSLTSIHVHVHSFRGHESHGLLGIISMSVCHQIKNPEVKNTTQDLSFFVTWWQSRHACNPQQLLMKANHGFLKHRSR